MTWHEDNWDNDESKFLAFTWHGGKLNSGDIFCALNAHSFEINFKLPSAPSGQKWRRLVDTNLPSPKDITPGGNAGVDPSYSIQGFSSIVLISK